MPSSVVEMINRILPDIKTIQVRNEVDYYGFSKYLSQKLQWRSTPNVSVSFRHGWMIGEMKYKEELLMDEFNVAHLVSKKEEVSFLKKRGVSNVYSVGAPYLYLDENEFTDLKRYSNSLLVMPPHSLPKSTHKWDEEAYIKEILAISSSFDSVVFCIHQNCEEKGLWIDSLKKFDLDWIIGADVSDENALVRMGRIFHSFEYVTTNNLGSHLVYAAYSGCKVSLYGKFIELKREALEAIEYYQEFPFVLDQALYKLSENYSRENYPFLFCEPKEALYRKKWAADELGSENKMSYGALAECIGWTKAGVVSDENCTMLSFSTKLNSLNSLIQTLKSDDKSYVLYGAGSTGKMIAQLLENKDFIFVDKASTHKSPERKPGEVYSLDMLNFFKYDYIVITLLGREKWVKDYLIYNYGISKDKILELKL